MVNSGAIIVTSLINNKANLADRFDSVSFFFWCFPEINIFQMINAYRRIAGGEHIGFVSLFRNSQKISVSDSTMLFSCPKERLPIVIMLCLII